MAGVTLLMLRLTTGRRIAMLQTNRPCNVASVRQLLAHPMHRDCMLMFGRAMIACMTQVSDHPLHRDCMLTLCIVTACSLFAS